MLRLMIPRLPLADRIYPYLHGMDASRVYVNNGPLVKTLEWRLGRRLGSDVLAIATSSGTIALEAAYHVVRQRGASEVEMTPLTFPATALAARRAGLRVRFVDVDPKTWTDGSVAAFGIPGTKGPVVDAAGAFGEQRVDYLDQEDVLTVFSLHATKVLGCGEGGFVVTRNESDAAAIRSYINFGFEPGGRVSLGDGTNGKMSEIHAAVALAALDDWDPRAWRAIDFWYRQHLPLRVGQQNRPVGVYPMLAVKLPCPAKWAQARMFSMGIETRRWYTPPLYDHPLFRDDPAKYPVSEDLVEHLLGLPYHVFMSEDDVAKVCRTLDEVINLYQETSHV